MNMTDSEIIRDYKAASNKVKQIGILADMNECKKGRIIEILLAHGVEIPGNFKKPVETAVPVIKPETPETPRAVKDGKVIMLEDILDIFVGVLTDYREAPEEVDREVAAKTTLAYMAGVADAYEAIYGPIVR